jgi:ketosteroid isomerase-like protein
MRKFAIALAVLLAATVVARKTILFAQGPQKPTPDTMKQLEAGFLKAALDHGSAGYMSVYAEDAVELPNGADPVVGKANIAKGMSFLDDKNNRLTWSPTSAGISASGDLGYTWGTFEFRSKQSDGTARVEHRKYMTLWKKQPDGNWKVAVDMGNAGPKQK